MPRAAKAAVSPRKKLGKSKAGGAIPGGTVHDLPADLKKALASDPVALAAWQDIKPLARNEWICWVTLVKKQETRAEHGQRMVSQLRQGKRRPCCWPGCPHHNPAARKWFEKRA